MQNLENEIMCKTICGAVVRRELTESLDMFLLWSYPWGHSPLPEISWYRLICAERNDLRLYKGLP